MTRQNTAEPLQAAGLHDDAPGSFQSRHIGPDRAARDAMLAAIGVPSLDALIDQTIPPDIRLAAPLDLPDGESEAEYLRRLGTIAARNRVMRSYIGYG
jgi:glycine dehydrogenase